MDIDEKKIKEATKLGLYIEFFVFCAISFIFLMFILGFIVSKIILVLMLAICGFHAILTLILIQALNIEMEVNK